LAQGLSRHLLLLEIVGSSNNHPRNGLRPDCRSKEASPIASGLDLPVSSEKRASAPHRPKDLKPDRNSNCLIAAFVAGTGIATSKNHFSRGSMLLINSTVNHGLLGNGGGFSGKGSGKKPLFP
jgi:hypothetical protein